jgi:polysaccharide transporter, PST family
MMFSNAALVYAAQLCRLAVPILVLPVVARRLEIDQFAALASAQALAYLVMIIPEYGYGTLGPRAIALLRDDPGGLRSETRRILHSKLLLCLPAILFAVIAGLLLPTLLGDWRIIAVMTLLGLMLGMNPGWFFQGFGKARTYALLDIGATLSFLALIILVPFGPQSAWLVLLMQAATLAAAVLAGHWMMHVVLGLDPQIPRQSEIPAKSTALLASLAAGFPLFLTKLASNVPGLGLLYVIGFSLKGDAVAHYAAAERLLMGSANALWPVMQILMPEIAERRRHDPSGAERLFRRGIFILVALGCLIGGFLFILAPLIISVLFGPKFTPAVEALRIVALALPCIALTNAISNGVLVARGRDWLLTLTIISAAALSLVLALTLIGPDDATLVPMIRLGVEAALAAGLTLIAVAVIRRES